MTTAPGKLALARSHLENVLAAWDEPTDWKDLSVYGFHCLEAAVDAASMHVGLPTSRSHWKREGAAEELHERWSLPDVSDLLHDLNDAASPNSTETFPALVWMPEASHPKSKGMS